MKRARLLTTSSILAAIAAALATIIALVGVASGNNSALAASSAVNGNFETGDLLGWTVDTTASGETASAVKNYTVLDPNQYCEDWNCLPRYLSVSPHEGSYFALLKVADQSQWTTISQPFTASNGDRISGWVFTLETLYQTSYNTNYFDDKGEVVLTDGSGTAVATLFKDTGSSGDYNSPWRYWEYTFTDLPGEGQFQIQAKQSSQTSWWSTEPNVLGLDDLKISSLGPDTTKPSTSATRSVEPNAAGWNNTDVTVKLKATDNEGGWGIKELTYRINGGEPITKQGQQVNSPIEVDVPTITAEGTTNITYYATDKAGNVEDEQSLQVNIDKTPPRVVAESISPADNATGVSPSATLSVTYLESGGSGIKASTLTGGFGLFRETRIPGGSTGLQSVSGNVSYNATTKTATFTPSHNLLKGQYLAYTNESVKDKAGNASDYKEWRFSVG